MQLNVRHSPSFSVARAELGPGQSLRVEAGAMMAMSAGMEMKGKMEGGFLKSLKRSALGGESFFITTYTAPSSGGWIDLAPNLPGDLLVRDVSPSGPLFITAGSWIACDEGVEFDTKWGGFRNLFGGEGGFIGRAEGQGQVVLSCYGALDVIELGAGQHVTIDTGHAVAWSADVTFDLRSAGGGVMTGVKSAEGLVFDFAGPGWVMTQSRNPAALISYLAANMPGNRA